MSIFRDPVTKKLEAMPFFLVGGLVIATIGIYRAITKLPAPAPQPTPSEPGQS